MESGISDIIKGSAGNPNDVLLHVPGPKEVQIWKDVKNLLFKPWSDRYRVEEVQSMNDTTFNELRRISSNRPFAGEYVSAALWKLRNPVSGSNKKRKREEERNEDEDEDEDEDSTEREDDIVTYEV